LQRFDQITLGRLHRRAVEMARIARVHVESVLNGAATSRIPTATPVSQRLAAEPRRSAPDTHADAEGT